MATQADSAAHDAGQLVLRRSDTDVVVVSPKTPPRAAPPFCPLCLRPFTATSSAGYSRGYFRTLTPPDADPTLAHTGLHGEADDQQATAAETTPGYYQTHFVEVCCVGRGSFGSVHVCRHVVGEETVGILAVKKVPVGNDAAYLRSVLTEVKLLEQVSHHPNVVQYHHSWLEVAQVSDFGPPVRCLFVLMEYASLGSLDQFIEQHGAALSDDAVWFLFLSALRGLAHLHQRGIIHRDIKADNILLAAPPRDADEAPRPMLADFGTACLKPRHGLSVDERAAMAMNRTGGTGTADYMAPEIISDAGGGCHDVHSVASDLYALGVVLHRLAFGGMFPVPVPPNATHDHRPATWRVRKGGVKRPQLLVELVAALLHPMPEHRPASCDVILTAPAIERIWARVERQLWSETIAAGAQKRPLLLHASVAAVPAGSPTSATVGVGGFPSVTPPRSATGDHADQPPRSQPAPRTPLGGDAAPQGSADDRASDRGGSDADDDDVKDVAGDGAVAPPAGVVTLASNIAGVALAGVVAYGFITSARRSSS